MTVMARKQVLAFAMLAALGACAAPPPPPRAATAPSGPLEPAPIPSDVTDDYLAARRAGTTAAPVGPDAMPGFDPGQRVGTDITTAPIPAGGPRLLGPR
jgi:hypothetical protein